MTGLKLIEKTQTWTKVPNGEFWRKCLVQRTADGTLRWVLVRDDVLAAAA